LPHPDKEVPMSAHNSKVLIEVAAQHEAIVRRALALSEELEQLALTAADGQVIHDCETAVVDQGRQLQQQFLSDAVARRIAAAEKKGPRYAPVSVDTSAKTKGPSNATC